MRDSEEERLFQQWKSSLPLHQKPVADLVRLLGQQLAAVYQALREELKNRKL